MNECSNCQNMQKMMSPGKIESYALSSRMTKEGKCPDCGNDFPEAVLKMLLPTYGDIHATSLKLMADNARKTIEKIASKVILESEAK